MRVGILFGGNSYEHDVSIISAKIINKYLTKKYQVSLLFLNFENQLFLIKRLIDENFLAKSKRISFVNGGIKNGLRMQKIDVLISVMHGANGEDGLAYSLANFYNIPYVGTNAISSGILMDKYYSYCVFKQNNYKVLSSKIVKMGESLNKKVHFPVIIKPITLGSSIGIDVVHDRDDFKSKIMNAFKYDKRLLVQKYVTDFREFNQAAFIKGGKVVLSKIEEVFKHDEILSFNDKYLGAKMENKHHFINDEILVDEISKLTESLYHLFDLSGVVRFDYMLTDDGLFINEINTTPGSLAYYLFDLSPEDLFDALIYEALYNYQNKHKLCFKSDILEHTNGLKKG